MGRRHTNRADIEDKVTKAIFALRELENQLEQHMVGLSASQLVLLKDRADLAELLDFMVSILSQDVITMRDYQVTNENIAELRRSIDKQQKQAVVASSLVTETRTKMVATQETADEALRELRSLGKVIEWTNKQ